MKPFKLPKKDKKIWVKALRSEQYAQCSGALRNNGGFCCLGVANECELTDTHEDEYENFVSEEFLPMDIQKKLAKMNDSGKWSFKRIATYIEKYL